MKYLLLFSALLCTASVVAQTYPIGTQTITYQDPARSNRNVQTYLYYPATTAGSNQPVAGGSFPVVVIGHGFTMNYAPYTYLADTLAPLGYIVAIVNTETGFSPSHSTFAADLAFVVGKLFAENSNAASPFYQHVVSQACIAGHSMGGGCTLLAAQNNPNVACTVTFALAETNPSAVAAAGQISAPSLVLSASDDCVAPAANHQTPAYNALAGCKAFVSLIDGGHCNFATSNFNCNFGEFTCNSGGPALPASTQRSITGRLMRLWADRWLKEQPVAGSQFQNSLGTYANQGLVTSTVACTSLPVELQSFTAQLHPDNRRQVLLRWQTAAERDVAFFTVESSADGVIFKPIGTESAQNRPASYTLSDANPWPGRNYYRLLTTDLDGRVARSPLAICEVAGGRQVRVWPNPSSGDFWVQMPENEILEQVRIFDSRGSEVWRQQWLDANEGPLQVSTDLTPGIYWLECRTTRGVQTVALLRRPAE